MGRDRAMNRVIQFFKSLRTTIHAWSLRKKIFSITAGIGLLAFWFCLPDPLFSVPYSYVIEDNHGELMGAMVARDGQWRFPASEKVPDKFAACLIAFEDKRFYYHPGVDPVAIGRAFADNIQRSRVVSGASTINMQVIRLARGQDRTLWQKMIEAVMAVRLELGYSKKEILALYAAHAPFGGNVVGLEAASWRYYGREPDDLTWAESATLAVLPNAPSLIHPGKNRQQLLDKRNRLLDKLFEQGTLDEATLLAAREESLPEQPYPLPMQAPHLLQWYKQQAVKGKLTGNRLRSTLESSVQRSVQEVLLRHHLYLRQNSIRNACALVLDVRNRKVLAYVGNIYDASNREHAMHVDIIRSRRSPGSLLKPVLYAAMMSDGQLLPHSLVPDIPTQMAGYVPQNFDLKYDGAVKASEVVSRSLNIPSVRMLRSYNYIRFHRLLADLGISTFDRSPAFYGLSMILGGGEVTMWEIAGMYGQLAQQYIALNHPGAQGTAYAAKAWTYLQDEGSVKNKSRPAVLDNASLWWMFSSMEDVMRPGEEVFWQQFLSSRRIAWKTGTSYGFRDAWAIGVTPEYVVGVWTGNANGEGRPGLVGVRTAAPILFEIFEKLPPTTWFEAPVTGITNLSVCVKSGYKAGPDCEETIQQTVPQATLKSRQCPYHIRVHLDQHGQRVHDQCESLSNMHSRGWFVLPPAMEQYYRQLHFDYAPLPAFRSDCQVTNTGADMEIVYPPKDAKIKVPRELDGTYEAAVFNVAHRRNDATVYWSLNDEFIAATTGTHKLPLRPEPGSYILTVVDDQGERRQVSFEIKQ